MIRQHGYKLLAILLVVMICRTSFADVPREISYQGLVTDAGGTPLDGTYDITFKIYDALVGGSVYYDSGPLSISVVNGLFNVNLPMADSIFGDTARYLGVTVESDPELTPRTKLTSVGYSYRVRTIDEATGGDIAGNIDVNNGSGDVRVRLFSNSQASVYGADNLEQTRLWGPSWGELLLYDSDPANHQTVRLSATAGLFADGGTLELGDAVGATTIALYGHLTGNDAVQFPNNSISDLEIQDEPGVANNQDNSTALGVLATTITSRSINCPSSGYVLAMSSGSIDFSHVSGTIAQGDIWITNSSSGSSGSGPNNPIILSGNAPSGSYEIPYGAQGVFAVASGLHTYYLRGSLSGNGGYSAVDNQLTLIFFPTAYGVIVSNAPANDADMPDYVSNQDLTGDQFDKARMAYELQQVKNELAAIKKQLGITDQNAAANTKADE